MKLESTSPRGMLWSMGRRHWLAGWPGRVTVIEVDRWHKSTQGGCGSRVLGGKASSPPPWPSHTSPRHRAWFLSLSLPRPPNILALPTFPRLPASAPFQTIMYNSGMAFRFLLHSRIGASFTSRSVCAMANRSWLLQWLTQRWWLTHLLPHCRVVIFSLCG
jgi:hypothetical protein